MKVDQGELRHFCDDPVCPDPVWKPSRFRCRANRATARAAAGSGRVARRSLIIIVVIITTTIIHYYQY